MSEAAAPVVIDSTLSSSIGKNGDRSERVAANDSSYTLGLKTAAKVLAIALILLVIAAIVLVIVLVR